MALTITDIEKLMRLMDLHKIDAVEFDGVKLTKSMFSVVEIPPAKQTMLSPEEEEDLLYFSS